MSNDLSKRILNLPPEKLELLMRRAKKEEKHAPAAITAQERDAESFPLSFTQQRLWFIYQLRPDNPAYNIPAAVRLSGALHVRVLEQAIREIVHRHETLRTTFDFVDGEPVQKIASSLPFMLPIADLSTLPPSRQEGEIERLTLTESRRPFDLSQGPLWRMLLLVLDDERYILLLTMHHIISDGWSLGIFIRELGLLYTAFLNGSPSPLSPLRIHYADYAVWQRQWLQGEALSSRLDYWTRQLQGAPGLLKLPTDKPRPAVQSTRGALRTFTISESLTAALRELSRQADATLFMTLLALFKLLLHRYTGETDIVVGSPVANRNRSDIEGIIGAFINTLVLRTDISDDPTFLQLLRRVRNVTLEAYTYQDLPFEKLVEEIKPDRNLSHDALFQVLFTFEEDPFKRISLPGLTLDYLAVHTGSAKRDLTLFVQEGGETLRGFLEYNVDLFAADTITRVIAHLQILMAGVVADPTRRLSQIPLLTTAERQQLLLDWNDTGKAYREKHVHRLFEEQAARVADAVAVVFEEEQLTYGALNRRANQVAHHLRERGVGPEVTAAICMERSPDMIVALLGVLKAGGAYVPLDPTYPQERLAFMLADAGVGVLLTQASLLPYLPEHDADVVCMDADRAALGQQPDENPERPLLAEQAAYVLYTSGSTGQPKGVVIEHRQLFYYVSAVLDALDLASLSRFAMVQPLTVDSCVTVIYPALCTGGALHLLSHRRISDAHLFAAYFERYDIECLKIAPSHLAALHTLSPAQRILPRRSLIVGGEASYWDWMERVRSAATCEIFNHYGPTETTVGVLTYAVGEEATRPYSATVPIGRPLPNVEAYLLDGNGRPVPMGVPGELYIGGRNLARGYLKRAALTAANFVPHPFSRTPGSRLYKTGDRARYLPGGHVEFLGRADNQVKVHGFRIELGEIESVLEQHTAVHEAVVTVQDDERAGKRLAAYVVAAPNGPLSADELRRFAGETLPQYMVPSFFTLLEELPRTPHGKVNRRALPAPTALPSQAADFVPPRTKGEQMIAAVWQEMLQVEKVGLYDNFFELGGHSLLLIKTHTRLQDVFQQKFPLLAMFRYSTVDALAKFLSREANEKPSSQQGYQRGKKQKEMMKRRRQMMKMGRKIS